MGKNVFWRRDDVIGIGNAPVSGGFFGNLRRTGGFCKPYVAVASAGKLCGLLCGAGSAGIFDFSIGLRLCGYECDAGEGQRLFPEYDLPADGGGASFYGNPAAHHRHGKDA